jgi:CelD/BcsL family acetyltransferase involved in cellulose biosynthesis
MARAVEGNVMRGRSDARCLKGSGRASGASPAVGFFRRRRARRPSVEMRATARNVIVANGESLMSRVSDYRVTVSTPSTIDADLLREIDALAADALDPNIFYEAWMLNAALAHIEVPTLTLVTVRDGSGALTGVFPFELARFRNLPLKSLKSWRHDYTFLATPLVARDRADATLDALLDWSASRRAPASILEFDGVREDGPFGVALASALARRPAFARHETTSERALLDLRGDTESGASHKHMKELRRQERRLADAGPLDYRAMSRDESAEPWIERFMVIESAGWKGRSGTALGAEAKSSAFFREIALEAHRRGALQMLELTLAGKPVAVKCNFLGGEGAYAFKIGHDETYAKFSPGVLLELFNMRYLPEAAPGAAWMDSCAKAQHFMINRLWTGRRAIANHSIAGRGLLARLLIRHGPRLAKWRSSVKAERENT